MSSHKQKLEKVEIWAEQMTEGRDASHAIEHFRRVREYTQQILAGLENDVADIGEVDGFLVAETAALVHDVFDHKYVSDNASGLDKMKEFLKSVELTEKEIDWVIEICENVSFSKEKKGKLNKDLPKHVMLLRNIVSDADKLDAIGYDGIERCRMYTRHRNPTGTEEEHERNVVEHMHDKLFRLLPYYIRTKPGKTIGAKLQREMLKYIEDKIE
ncbi:Oidioi.mRNA.OKI2018_I69.chr2.g7009.t1.cds [Oikopleura dioica]|uniref:Oidioi.mRNA.OKI2018_I69.chr2.g7009.t1.cds n=1 Tax=Oikopleura dioica TaxID=34765 RepID=A0ABN7T4S9_OIKDI|nr:Oidioi.mRNA.OKI2018_I69.chr2.g7009.t1.cds [Oikopleura dioica]